MWRGLEAGEELRSRQKPCLSQMTRENEECQGAWERGVNVAHMRAPFQPLRTCAARRCCKWPHCNGLYRACQRKSLLLTDANFARNDAKMLLGECQQTEPD
jgi:hypothetical protein